jgi:hypothetical protein
MKKILSCLCLVVVAAAWLTACSDDDDDNKVSNEFTVNDQKYALSTGYYDSVRMQTVGTDVYHFWNVVMASDGISFDSKFVGTGDAVRFDLYTKQEGRLPVGTYKMSDVDNGIQNASAFVGFNTETGDGTIYADQVDDASVTIEEASGAHTITFTIKLDNGKEIRGAFRGTLSEVSNF